MNEKYKQFILESNRIEGENRINPGDEEAIKFALAMPVIRMEEILHLHKLLGDYLKKPWVGKLRDIDVRVGYHVCPRVEKVPDLMEDYIERLPYMDSWEAHNSFEKIHPFQDLNGRVGRLIWLNKTVWNERYNFKIPFLQAYYYQTLSKAKL